MSLFSLEDSRLVEFWEVPTGRFRHIGAGTSRILEGPAKLPNEADKELSMLRPRIL